VTHELPTPPVIPGVTWRAAEPSDAAAIVVLQDACFEVDNTYREVESEILERFADEMIDPPNDSLVGVRIDGSMVASVWSMVATSAETKWRAFAVISIDPPYRTPELEEFCLSWWEARSAERLADTNDDLPKVLWRGAYEHQGDAIDLLTTHGYAPARYYDELIRDLDRAIEPFPLGDGLRFVPAEDAGEGDELWVHNEAFRDHWGSQPWTPERWEQFKNEFYLPDASFLVYDDAQPVGHIMCSAYPHDFDDRGWSHAWIESLGVIRSHRKRGIASSMVTASLNAFAAAGYEKALLDVDSENPTGAYRLYEELGFTHDRRSITFTKTIP
jgi:mycothiol synthase